jgi:putative hydrolases of HD superfamily
LDRLLNLLESVNNLKQLPRTGWLLAGVAMPESVADHTCAVALYAFFLADIINADPGPQGLAQPLDTTKVLQIALLHDLAESLLTDLPKRTSQLLGNGVKHSAEDAALVQLLDGQPGGEKFRTLWQEYASGSTPEGRLVKDADKLEMVHQALLYQRRGHANLEEFWQGHDWSFPISRLLFQSLCQVRNPSHQGGDPECAQVS